MEQENEGTNQETAELMPQVKHRQNSWTSSLYYKRLFKTEKSLIHGLMSKGVNPGGDGGTRPPPIFIFGGDEYLIVPPIFSYVQ